MAFFANLVLFLALSLSVGLGSAWYALEKGLPMTTRKAGPWKIWHEAGRVNADPYTSAYVARAGWLPITSSHALYYITRHDSEGGRLTGECNYILTGSELDADWWSLGLFDSSGRPIANKAKRYAFNSANTVRNADGSFSIWISSEARPGNWLPNNSDTENMLVLRIFGPGKAEEAQSKNEIELRLPKIKRLSCR